MLSKNTIYLVPIVSLAFESVFEMLWYYRSNETSGLGKNFAWFYLILTILLIWNFGDFLSIVGYQK